MEEEAEHPDKTSAALHNTQKPVFIAVFI